MKTLVEIETEQVDILTELCQRDGISRAEGIRRAITHYGRHQLPPKNPDAYFGYLKGRGIDSLSYVDKLRDEW